MTNMAFLSIYLLDYHLSSIFGVSTTFHIVFLSLCLPSFLLLNCSKGIYSSVKLLRPVNIWFGGCVFLAGRC